MPRIRRWFDEPNNREYEVLDLIARGYLIYEIANKLHLTRHGVESRLTTLRRLHKLQTNHQLYVLAGQLGWASIKHPLEKRSSRG